jgi:uncharacterized phage protein gp47/JayE
MPNTINENGITIQTAAEIRDNILNGTPDYLGLRQIYGDTINVNPNSPDGQMVNIVAQAKLDILEFALQIYASFDPDEAVGTQLDARCAINGVIRNPGSYTLQQVEVTVTQSVTINGLDAFPVTGAFVVQDSTGNRYSPLTTQNIVAAGTYTIVFRALVLGAIESSPNTITTIATIQAGITAVNNPSGPSSIGLIEETDSALRIRRQNSVSLPSQGYLQGMIGALLNTEDVLQAIVIENNTGVTDLNGIPGHSIWCIVLGGSNEDVASVIYRKRNAGCGMFGSVTVPVLQVDGTLFDVSFSRPTDEQLYISFDIEALTGAIDVNYIRAQLLARLQYGINQTANTTAIVVLVNQLAPNASVTNEGLSLDDITYEAVVSPSTVDKKFILSASSIIINGTPG